MRLPLCDTEHDLSDVAMLPLTCAATNMERRMNSAEESKIPLHAVWQPTTRELDAEVTKLWSVIVLTATAIGSAVWTLYKYIS
jgi:hypothetical protein